MDKNVEVMRQALDLADTILEGLEYVERQLTAGNFEGSVKIMGDVMEGYSAVERSIIPFIDKLDVSANLKTGLNQVRARMSEVVKEFESQDEANLKEKLTNHLLPAFSEFKSDMEKVFKPYIVS